MANTGTGEGMRPAIAILMSDPERSAVDDALADAGFETIQLMPGTAIAEAFSSKNQSIVAVVDVAGDPDAIAANVAEARRGRPGHLSVLFVAGEDELDGLQKAGIDENDEIVLRPAAVDALRWRVEAMAIRLQVPTGQSSDAVLSGGHLNAEWTPAAPVFAVFNPKGGVGKTTVATNLASALRLNQRQSVLLVDADTVTGHVGMSLGLDGGRSAVDSWTDEEQGYAHESLIDIAQTHTSGIKVVSLATDPLRHPTLKGDKVGDSLAEARHQVDAVVVDMHPSYNEVTLAVFAIADRILVPVTPDLPAMRAAIQLKEVATEVGVRDRLSLIINRANSGVTVKDMEETIGLQAMAHVRSAGLHFVWSANAGMTLIDKFPRHPATQDFEHLADRLIAVHMGAPMPKPRETGSLLKNIFGRKAITQA
ncbi:MAG TPA: AAA family ATPase [Solirubrobacterales bacterium]|nr:AAA family ATPase [Solirubrobacterales bacterium]